MITPLPDPPSRDDPTTFADKADEFLGALPRFRDECSALEQSLQLVSTTGTSGTTLTIGTGSRGLFTQLGRAWVVGAYAYLVDATNVSNLMYGQITEYNALTGSLTVNVTYAIGGGTFSNWVIGLSVPSSGSAEFAGDLVVRTQVICGGLGYGIVRLAAGDGTWTGYVDFRDSDDVRVGYIGFGHKTDKTLDLAAVTGGYWRFIGGQAPRCNADAADPDALVRLSQMQSNISTVATGGFQGLTLEASGANSNITLTAELITLLDGAGKARTFSAVNRTFNSAAALDAGSMASNTWYSVWLISDASGTLSERISLSSTSPTMPGGWTFKRRVGWMRADGTGNMFPFAFKQKGRRAQWVVAPGTNLTAQPVMAAGVQGSVSAGTWVAVSTAGFAPPTAARIQGAVANSTTAAGTTMAHPNASAGAYGSLTNPPAVSASIGVGARTVIPFDFLLESSNIYCAADQTDSRVYAIGWEDNL